MRFKKYKLLKVQSKIVFKVINTELIMFDLVFFVFENF